MFHAYRYRLEYSGRREWGKFAIQICLWHRSTNEKPRNLSKRTCCRTESSRNDVLLNCTMLYSCLVSFEVLQFSNANRIVSSLRKGTRFWCPEVHFQVQSPCFPGQLLKRKDSGDENTSSFGTRTSSLGGPRLPPEVVSARLNFSARGPKNLLLHGKNQADRALYYWPACQNLGVPYSKWMSCKCAFSRSAGVPYPKWIYLFIYYLPPRTFIESYSDW